MAKICKRGHVSSTLPGGRNKRRNCIECKKLVDAAYIPDIEARRNSSRKWKARMKAERPIELLAQRLYHSARERARERGLPVPTITLTWTVEKLRVVTHCLLTLCGHTRLTPNISVPQANSPSLDRRDTRLGYTPENTALICYGCNRKKSDLSIMQLHELLLYATGGI